MKNCNRIITGKEVTDKQVRYLKDVHAEKGRYLGQIAGIDFGEEGLRLEDVLEIYRVFTANVRIRDH